jgi:hypothetical protein
MVMIVMRATAPAMIGAIFRPSSCLESVVEAAAVPGNAGAKGSRKTGSGGEIVVVMGLGGETGGAGVGNGGAKGDRAVSGDNVTLAGACSRGKVGDIAVGGMGCVGDPAGGGNGGAGGNGETVVWASGAGHSIKGRDSASFATSSSSVPRRSK